MTRSHTVTIAALPGQVLELYGCAVLSLAGADGELSKRERDLLLEEGRRRGIPEPVLAGWAGFDWQAADRRELLTRVRPLLRPAQARLLIYDAIRTARADGSYALEERRAIEDAAELLGLDPEVVNALVGLVEMEEAVRKVRQGLIEEGGRP